MSNIIHISERKKKIKKVALVYLELRLSVGRCSAVRSFQTRQICWWCLFTKQWSRSMFRYSSLSYWTRAVPECTVPCPRTALQLDSSAVSRSMLWHNANSHYVHVTQTYPTWVYWNPSLALWCESILWQISALCECDSMRSLFLSSLWAVMELHRCHGVLPLFCLKPGGDVDNVYVCVRGCVGHHWPTGSAFPVFWIQDQVSQFSQRLLVLFNRKWAPSEGVWAKLSKNQAWQAGILACDGSQ